LSYYNYGGSGSSTKRSALEIINDDNEIGDVMESDEVYRSG